MLAIIIVLSRDVKFVNKNRQIIKVVSKIQGAVKTGEHRMKEYPKKGDNQQIKKRLKRLRPRCLPMSNATF